MVIYMADRYVDLYVHKIEQQNKYIYKRKQNQDILYSI